MNFQKLDKIQSLIRRLSILACAGACLAAAEGTADAQGYSPEEAPRHMTLPEGLEVQLVASEPMIRQPVAIEFDDQGRLWVIQYLQYPNPAGLKRAKVDRYSRTTYDRFPEPPPRGPRGADRITILEDTDGDGRADRAKDFVSGLNLASGLAFGHGGVFVLQVPYLLFYPDRNRDDVPDGDPEVLASGFGMEDAHSVANSLTWGPDGWLYGCQGSTVTSNIRGIEFQQGVWRYHPITHAFELFCEGGGNSWGLDFDEHGNLFYSTNYGGYALLHGVQGAYYWKQFGKHGALHNPYAYGYFDHVPHKDLRGGHVTVGGIVYQGDSFPPQFRGTYVAADLLGHAAYWHQLHPRGSTFSASFAGDLLLANDTWFAPSDVTMGPDGSIYICDWHDQRTAHPDPDAEWDRTNGRIYRIKASGLAPRGVTQLTGLPSKQLIGMLAGTNDWYVRKARRILADRLDPEAIFPLRTRVMESKDDHEALEALWALYTSGGLDDEFAEKLLGHPNADIRWWCVRLQGDEECVAPAIARRMAELAGGDPSVAVRSQLASTAKRLSADQALPIVKQLVARSEDSQDPFLPLLVWWAVERHSIAARAEVLAMFSEPAVWQLPIARETILPRLVRRYAAEGTEPGYLACARLLAATPAADRDDIFAALDQGLKDRSTTRGGSAGDLFARLAVVGTGAHLEKTQLQNKNIPQQLGRQIDVAWQDDTSDMTLIRLAARLGRPAAQVRAIALATDARTPLAKRIEAAQLLGEVGQPSCVERLLKLLSSSEPQPLQSAVLNALQQFEDEGIATALLARYPTMEPGLRAKTCDVLLSRKPWAARLLEGVDEGKYAAKDIAVDQLRLISLHDDEQLNALVKKHWGSIQGGTPEERLAEMRRINNDLRAGRGDVASGKVLFTKHCGMCHKLFGEGNQIGPELTHANRKNTDELLSTIVSPSAVIRKEFMSFVVQTTDGRVLTGLLAEQSPASVTLLGAKNERTVIERNKIDAINESPTSLMPENLLSPLKPQEVRDLFSYLQSEESANSPSPAGRGPG
ncbi:MAG TPA: PVC-type heme-binding CxxCH protein [Pirellulales bacterium]|nr:PVC-type heme-binding CxxCH protein [Pirellulales bacterium]